MYVPSTPEEISAIINDPSLSAEQRFEVVHNLLITATAKHEAEVQRLTEKFSKLGFTFLKLPEKGDAQKLRYPQWVPTLTRLDDFSFVQDKSMADHKLIESDNLTALVLLATLMPGTVDVIPTDPPYNTGDDGKTGGSAFVYNDKIMSSEDPKFHSAWLSFMIRRLILMRELLRETGVLMVAIGQEEFAHLKIILDDVMGAHNYITMVTWAGDSTKNDARFFSNTTDYTLVYARNKQRLIEKDIKWRANRPGALTMMEKATEIWEAVADSNPFATSDERAAIATKEFSKWFRALPDESAPKRYKGNSNYANIDSQGRVFRTSDISWPGGGGPRYDILHPVTGKPVAVPSRGWAAKESTMQQWIADGKVLFGADHTTQPAYKRYIEDVQGVPMRNLVTSDRSAATKHLRTIIGNKPDGKPLFNNPKDVNVIADLIEYVTPDFRKEESATDPIIILDPFAGSGTTGHSVLQLNEDDPDTHRRFILVTNNEDPTSPDDGDSETGVARDVTSKRLRAVLSGKWADGKQRDPMPGNLHYYKVEWSNLGSPSAYNKSEEIFDLAEKMASKFAGLAAFSSGCHHPLTLEGDSECGTRYVILTDGNDEICVVWQNHDDPNLTKGEKLILETLEKIKVAFPAKKYTAYIPSDFDDVDIEPEGWKTVAFPKSYIKRLRTVITSRLLSSGLLEPMSQEATAIVVAAIEGGSDR